VTSPRAARRCEFPINDELGLPGELTFDSRSDLLLSKSVTNYGRPQERVVVRIESWREVAGVLFPDRVIATDSSGDFVLDFVQVEVNPAGAPSFATTD
jgi:hypothetical protein